MSNQIETTAERVGQEVDQRLQALDLAEAEAQARTQSDLDRAAERTLWETGERRPRLGKPPVESVEPPRDQIANIESLMSDIRPGNVVLHKWQDTWQMRRFFSDEFRQKRRDLKRELDELTAGLESVTSENRRAALKRQKELRDLFDPTKPNGNPGHFLARVLRDHAHFLAAQAEALYKPAAELCEWFEADLDYNQPPQLLPEWVEGQLKDREAMIEEVKRRHQEQLGQETDIPGVRVSAPRTHGYTTLQDEAGESIMIQKPRKPKVFRLVTPLGNVYTTNVRKALDEMSEEDREYTIAHTQQLKNDGWPAPRP